MPAGVKFDLKRSEPRGTPRNSRTFILDGVGPVLFEKTRRARRISLTVRASRGIRVAVPWRVSFQEARSIALAKLGWIRRTLAHVERARNRCRDAVLAAECLDRRTAQANLSERLGALALEHGYSPGRLCVRCQGTVWGSASCSGRIQLNALLAVVPPDLADYVILHELVHTRVRGHGPAFWAELESRMPDARRRQSRLREYSQALF
jgi:predicted metal-dependent hydrolase